MSNLLLALFLFAHGMVHASYLAPEPAPSGGPPWPFKLDDSWLLTRIGARPAAMVAAGQLLAAFVIGAFTLAAAGLLAGGGWWAPVAVVAAVASLVQLTVWFHWWLPVGVVIDLVLITAVVADWTLLASL